MRPRGATRPPRTPRALHKQQAENNSPPEEHSGGEYLCVRSTERLADEEQVGHSQGIEVVHDRPVDNKLHTSTSVRGGYQHRTRVHSRDPSVNASNASRTRARSAPSGGAKPSSSAKKRPSAARRTRVAIAGSIPSRSAHLCPSSYLFRKGSSSAGSSATAARRPALTCRYQRSSVKLALAYARDQRPLPPPFALPSSRPSASSKSSMRRPIMPPIKATLLGK